MNDGDGDIDGYGEHFNKFLWKWNDVVPIYVYMYKEALKIKVVTVDLMHIGPEYGGRPSARHKVVSSSDRKYAAFHDLDSHSVVKSRYSLSKSEYQLFL